MGENPHHKAASQFLVNSRETCPSPQPFSEQPSGLPQNKDKPRNAERRLKGGRGTEPESRGLFSYTAILKLVNPQPLDPQIECRRRQP
jgi:hypothetical protein